LIELIPAQRKYQKVEVQFLTPENKPLKESEIEVEEFRDVQIQKNKYITDGDGKTMISLNTESEFYFEYNVPGARSKKKPTIWYSHSFFNQLGNNQTIRLKSLYPIYGRLVSESGTPVRECPIWIDGKDIFNQNSSIQNMDFEGVYFWFENVYPGNAKGTIYSNPTGYHYLTKNENLIPIKSFDITIPENATKGVNLGDLLVKLGNQITLNFNYPEGYPESSINVEGFKKGKSFFNKRSHDGQLIISSFNEIYKDPIKIVMESSLFQPIVLEEVEFKTQSIDISLEPKTDIFTFTAIDEETGESLERVKYILQYKRGKRKYSNYTKTRKQYNKTPVNLGELEEGDYILSVVDCNTAGISGQRIGYKYFKIEKNQPGRNFSVKTSLNSGKEVKGLIINKNRNIDIRGKVRISKGITSGFEPLESQITSIYPDGTFSFSRVAPGDYYFQTMLEKQMQKDNLRFTVNISDPPPFLEVPVYAYGNIEGLFLGLESTSKGKVLVTATNQEYPDFNKWTPVSKEGHFTLTGIFPGKYSLKSPYQIHHNAFNEKVTIQPDEPSNIKCDLSNAVVLTSKIMIDGKRQSLTSLKKEKNTLICGRKSRYSDPDSEFYISSGTYTLKQQDFDNLIPVTFVSIPDDNRTCHIGLEITSSKVKIQFELPEDFEKTREDIPVNFTCIANNGTKTSGLLSQRLDMNNRVRLFISGTYTFQADINEDYHINSGPIEITAHPGLGVAYNFLDVVRQRFVCSMSCC
jgi:hypothetical protein